jgi:hypothetical protein
VESLGDLGTEVTMLDHRTNLRLGECSHPREHDAQAFLLNGAVSMGTWECAGLNPEYDGRGHLLGVWKIMRCGCTYVSVSVL